MRMEGPYSYDFEIPSDVANLGVENQQQWVHEALREQYSAGLQFKGGRPVFEDQFC